MRLIQTLFLALFFTLQTADVLATNGEISGISWLDANRDGILDAGEPGQDTEVQLIRSSDGFVYSTTTSSDGRYAFTDLPNGNYQLIFLPEGRVIPTYGRFLLWPSVGDSAIETYSAPFQHYTSLSNFTTLRTVNAGWVDDGDICQDGLLRTRYKQTCTISDSSLSEGMTATVNLPNPDYTYLWSGGQTTQSALFTEDQLYSVTVTDPSGCKYVDRGYFSLANAPEPSIDLGVKLFPCGEDVLPYRLPDSILDSDFNLRVVSNLTLGLSIDDLQAGDVEITQSGKLLVALVHPTSGCRIRLNMVVGKPVPTDELYLEVIADGPDNCGPTNTIQVRGGQFGRFYNNIPPGHEVQFFGPDGRSYYGDVPRGYPFILDKISLQEPGTYTALVTSACGPDRYLTITTPDPLICRAINGRLVLDQNGGCSAEGSLPVPGTLIAFTSTTSTAEFYTLSEDDGSWGIDLPEGFYTIRPLTNPQLAATYCNVGVINVEETPLPSLNLVFAQTSACPVLTTAVIMPRLRRDFLTISHVTYQNEGTGAAEDVTLKVELDPHMMDLTADHPFTRSGNTYTFQLGLLPPFSNGRIELRYYLREAAFGEHHCIKANISPADICVEPTGWQGGMIRVDYGSCDGESLTFIVTNVGTEVTSVDINYYIISNGVLYQPLTTLGTLLSGASSTIELPANGDTYQIFTNQEPNAPAAIHPSAVAEGCVQNPDNAFNTGFAGQFPIGSGILGDAIACRENTGSYDPNEKLGYPYGIGIDKDIAPGTRITYDVHFQNTGTDTAFIVLIKDTLPTTLNLSSLRLEGASHDYVASIDTNRVLTFRFDNILLPDSSTNLVASQGLVQFSIDHDSTLVRGDRFRNNAAIYFDFNDPVITDYSRHRIAPELLVNPLATAASIINVENASCGLSNGSVSIVILEGLPPFTYAWSHDEQWGDSVATGLTGGDYFVTITGANGATTTLQQSLTAYPDITASSVPNIQPTTCGQSNGSIRVNLIGGAETLTYSWSHAAGLNSPFTNGLPPGDYSLTVSDETACTYTSSYQVPDVPKPTLRLEAQEDMACAGALGSATFILSHFGPETDLGLVAPGITLSREQLGPDSFRLVVQGIPAGDYLPMVIDENGCRAEVALRIAQVPPVALGLVHQYQVSCNGAANGRVEVRATEGSLPYVYDWNGDGEDDGPTQDSLPVGEYEVVVTDSRGCTATFNGVITEPEVLQATTVVTPSTCAGNSTGSIQLNVTGGLPPYTYRWLELPLETGNSADSLTAGVYNVLISDANSCETSITVNVTEAGNNIVISETERSEVSCLGASDGSITVLASGSPEGFTYLWDDGQTGPTASGLSGSQNYIVVITNANGCSSQLRLRLEGGTMASFDELPKDTFICAGDNYVLDLSSYVDQLVTGPAGFSSQQSQISLMQGGIYNIQATNALGCIVTGSLSLEVTDSTFAAVASMARDAVITLPFPVEEGSIPFPDSIYWRYDPEMVTLTNQEERTYFFAFNEPGDYNLGLIAYLQGCQDSTYATVTIHADSSTITNLPFLPASSVNLRVAPNPSDGVFSISANLPTVSTATALLYNAQGRLIFERPLVRAATIQERFEVEVPAGIYYLYLIAAEGRWMVPVVIK